MASRVCQDLQVLPESQGNLALRVWLVRPVLWGLQEPGENEALLERGVRWDQMDCQDPRVALELLDQMDQRALREPKVALESLVHKD